MSAMIVGKYMHDFLVEYCGMQGEPERKKRTGTLNKLVRNQHRLYGRFSRMIPRGAMHWTDEEVKFLTSHPQPSTGSNSDQLTKVANEKEKVSKRY